MIVTVLCCNRLSFTKATISSFLGHNKEARDFTWVALDNGSTDGTKEYLEEKGLFTEVIDLPENIGLHPGMNRLFDEALKVGSGEEYFLHLENDWWSMKSADFPLVWSILDSMPDVGAVQMREVEDEYDQIKTYNPYYWHEGDNTLRHLVKVRIDKSEWWDPEEAENSINWFSEFERKGRKFAITDWHWTNNPGVVRTSIIKDLFTGVQTKRKDGMNEAELMKSYYKMKYKTIRDIPGTFRHFGYIQVGRTIAKTAGAKFV